MSLCLGMVALGLLGLWADRKLGTKVVFTLLGFAGGMSLGIWRLVQMTAENGDHDDAENRRR